jgi:hypothetical protein
MAYVAIELADAGVLAARGETLSAPSPGIALLEPAGAIVGRAAVAQARLKPVYVADRFWADLSRDPMPRAAARARSHADLAHAHLSQLWAEVAEPGDAALFAVPGDIRGSALGLLAGVAGAAGIEVRGWIDAAVAACAALPSSRETVLHIDIGLHEGLLTVLEGESTLRRRRVDVAPRVGLKPLYAAWGQLIAEALVRRTRFDPLHQAATEQQLFDRLPAWLGALAMADEVEVEVEASAGVFGATLRREQFTFVAESWYSQLLDLVHAGRRAGTAATIALSSRAALLPGFAARCAGIADAEVVSLADGASARGALQHAAVIAAGTQPSLLVELPRAVPAARPARAHAASGEAPTHVLHAGRAQAILAEPLYIGLEPAGTRSLTLPGGLPGVSRLHCSLVRECDAVIVRDASRYGTFVNGERVAGSARLVAGDRLRLGTPGLVLELVTVG